MILRKIALVVAFVVALGGQAAAQPIVRAVSELSAREAHPIAAAAAPTIGAYHVVGGGAHADWSGAGSLLFNSILRHGTREWVAQSKDHLVSDHSTVTSYVLYFEDARRQYEVRPFYSQSSASDSNPSARASVPSGWVLTGGGCSVDWRSAMGPGSMLTGSYPAARRGRTFNTWVCEARDLGGANPATVIAVAIGIRPLPDSSYPARMPVMCVAAAASETGHATLAQAPNCAAEAGGQITGGGARVVMPSYNANQGHLLTASYPLATDDGVSAWEARSKAHLDPSPGIVTAYAISLVF